MRENEKTRPIEWDCCCNCTNRRLLTVKEAAAVCGVCTDTLYKWMNRGDIEWCYTPSDKRLIYLDSLVRKGLVRRADLAPFAPEAA